MGQWQDESRCRRVIRPAHSDNWPTGLSVQIRPVDDQRMGSVIRLLRRRKGWRQQDLAEAAGASKSAVGRLERGHVDSSTIEQMRRIAAALDVRIDLVPRWRGGEL